MIIKQVVRTPVTVNSSLIQDYTRQKSLIQFTINDMSPPLALSWKQSVSMIVKRKAPKAWILECNDAHFVVHTKAFIPSLILDFILVPEFPLRCL